jgi:ribosomal protein S18 acetylase RimI-like enzyme
MVKVCKARPKDFDKIFNLINPIVNKPSEKVKSKIYKYLTKREKVLLVAKDKKKLIGYTFVDFSDDDPKTKKLVKDSTEYTSIAWVGVDENYRKKGVGARLLRKAEKITKKWKRKGMVLDCRKAVIPFYEKSGFKKAGYFIKPKKNKKRRQYVMEKRVRMKLT